MLEARHSAYSPEGNPRTAKIAFVGEAPAKEEMRQGRPLAPNIYTENAGRIHEECLEHAGILRAQCYTTNVFDYPISKPKGDKANFFTSDWHPRGSGHLLYSTEKGFSELGMQSLDRLSDELGDVKANVIVPLGGPALLAICGKRGITKWRGSILPATIHPIVGRKCVPTIHPINASYGEYINRYIIKHDYERAHRESSFPEIRRPDYRFILHPTFRQCIEILEWLHAECISPIAVDIEIMFGQVERISYTWSEQHSISIPYLGWEEEQEALLWLKTAELLENNRTEKVFQNGVFDCQILAMIHGILIPMEPGEVQDTMIGHHIMYPDFRKGLAFLASLHTDQEYWKDLVDHGPISKEEG